MILNRIPNTYSQGDCTQAYISLKMQEYEQQGETIVLRHIKICG